MRALIVFAAAMLPLAGQAQTVDCPDTVGGHRLGVVDVFDGPPSDNYLQTPNQPGRRDVWDRLDKLSKQAFVICHYQGGATRQFQLSRAMTTCTATRAANDTHTGLSCR